MNSMRHTVRKHKIVGLSFLAVAFIVLAVIAWSKSQSVNLEEFPELQKQVEKYYAYEKEGEWEKAYLIRTPNYRSTVSLQFYLKTMKKDNEGWGLLNYDIIQSRKIGDNKIKLKIKFLENMAPDFAGRLGAKTDNGTFDVTQDTIWKFIDGVWYCVESGSRMHLSLNSGIVVE